VIGKRKRLKLKIFKEKFFVAGAFGDATGPASHYGSGFYKMMQLLLNNTAIWTSIVFFSQLQYLTLNKVVLNDSLPAKIILHVCSKYLDCKIKKIVFLYYL
jgi:hypothetical protein